MEVVFNEAESRYELKSPEDLIGIADVVERDGVMEFPHVFVEPRFRNQGFAERLVREALADVRSRGLEVVAQCPYVVAYVRRHPESVR
jgi:predicted GNAT family acetyltransferase